MTAQDIIKAIEFGIASANQLSSEQIENIVIGADIWLADNVFDIELDVALKIEHTTDALRGLIDFYGA